MDSLKEKNVSQEKYLDELNTRSRPPNSIFKGVCYNAQDNHLSDVISKFWMAMLNVNVNSELIYVISLGRNQQ